MDKQSVIMVRSVNAGVFYGHLEDIAGSAVTLTSSRRVWRWAGAATLSELATRGTSKPSECKFPCSVPGRHVIFDVCEILPVTPEALVTLDEVPEWSA